MISAQDELIKSLKTKCALLIAMLEDAHTDWSQAIYLAGTIEIDVVHMRELFRMHRECLYPQSLYVKQEPTKHALRYHGHSDTSQCLMEEIDND